MTFAHFWQELVTTALLGTEQPALPALPPAGEPLDGVLARLDPGSPEQAILRMAALAAIYRRAGQRPPRDQQPVSTPCTPDETPRCPRHVMHRIATMLNGDHRDALPECLTRIAARGWRISEEALPELLDAGAKDGHLRPVIGGVIGRRGRWLAAQNERWSYAAVVDTLDERAWQEGTPVSRVAYLQQVRAEDPARARDLVAAAWNEESPDSRIDFLNVLIEHGLSMDDEPFLESLLDVNKRDKARVVVCQALARLPDSRLIQRMIARTHHLIKARRRGKKIAIEVELPQAYTDEMARDGISREIGLAGTGLGERAYWLSQTLCAMPLTLWTTRLKATPLELVRAATGSDWENLLIGAWTTAAILQANADWAEAFTSLGGRNMRNPGALLKVMPMERVETAVLDLIQSTNHKILDKDHPALPILKALEVPWSERMTSAVWTLIRESLLQMSRDIHAVRDDVGPFARYMAPSAELAAQADDMAYAVEDVYGWHKTMTDFAGLIRFRQEMHEELSQ